MLVWISCLSYLMPTVFWYGWRSVLHGSLILTGMRSKVPSAQFKTDFCQTLPLVCFILRELMSPYFIAERARSVYPLSLKHVQTQHGVLIPSKRSKWPWAQNFIFSFSPTNTYLVGNMWAFSSLKKKKKHNKPIGKWGSVKVTCDGFLVTIKPKIDWGNLNCATCWMEVKVKQVKIILWK